VSGFPTTVADASADALQRIFGTVSRRRASWTDASERLPDLVQLNATVQPGNSGGPVLAADDGSVVGITTLRNPVEQNESYAIAPGRARALLEYLEEGTSTPGMTLAYGDDGSAPQIVGVSSRKLLEQGVEGQDENGLRQRLVAIRKADGTAVQPTTPVEVCGALGMVGDHHEDVVEFRFEGVDGHRFKARMGY
jgi:S1-C subfamily serine protease